jgi:hypothetical protein
MKQTIKQHLELQIKNSDLWDAEGTLTPETLWGLIIHYYPDLKSNYVLDSEYSSEILPEVVSVVSSLALQCQKSAHLKHIVFSNKKRD